MNTHDLVAFVAVVETGSIVAASARLNLTQPGVTRRIQNLEEMLGAQLLDRLSKPLKPTAAGIEAYEQGRRLLRMLDDLKSGVASDGVVRGEFRLGLTPYLSEAGLAGPLDAVRAEFPALAVRVVAGLSPHQVDAVSRNELDAAAICIPDGAVPPADLAADDLGAQPVIFVVARDIKLPKSADLEWLSRMGWVMNQDGCGFRQTLKRQFEAAHLPFNVAVEALDSELRLSLVARGLGIGVVTPVALKRSALRSRLKVVRIEGFDAAVRAWIVHRPPAGRLTRPIEVFRDALDRELQALIRA
ncbi:LysR family transcriptional regulator [Bradyrhizobium viridifuturi]|jgi:DNA-binding transcriptional LysR family regulator|uniref:LysR family transcriptional regulator n=1 Tax=Bradyrhizobium TaxID=374 RepID=UPI00039801A8|nr:MULTISPECIES: LysR family transcriptional regulator [Bradyrhizobium]ERF80206.1 MAG: dihydrodipicolinate synthase [Bradyrhizobium sp. DFCI-1]OYU58946.1 MAG: LysR family transcriptional regulator [Bradyrhizobium sp. PARBB1]PSO28733.1 LysR family transcriptional regulator [Bradyrhizobium sp. MOS004]QRI72347.1 LysR family transcriptional regulator [Bradyrhizobium sp. PSBB068]MBR1021366.1 LysR family transcriptional regulator [Bradyrhizobium viridifuturi]